MSADRINSNREPPRKSTPTNRPTMDSSGRFVAPNRKADKTNFQNILERTSGESDLLLPPTPSTAQPSATATREAV
ncbi:MAG: hypothetical protein HY073_02020, partial [Deltaproteobacteria bacterium]|nr:hypothetical protein [Deltaproteobacteria bacterium]